MFRIGVTLGEVLEQENGAVYADGVNVAARLQALAEPCDILVSEAVHEEAENRPGQRFEFLGEQEVRNHPKLIGTYGVVRDDSSCQGEQAPLESPAKPRIVLGSVAEERTRTALRRNFGAPSKDLLRLFVGRHRELDELRQALDCDLLRQETIGACAPAVDLLERSG